MVRYTTFFAIVILVVSIFGLFQVKFYVQDLSKDIIELGRQLKQEKESLHILKAEWTYLNQPERLRQLAGKYLQLEIISNA
jgi:cell division protein FtsL